MDYCIRYGGKNRWHCKFFLVYLHFIAGIAVCKNTYGCDGRCSRMRSPMQQAAFADTAVCIFVRVWLTFLQVPASENPKVI